MNRGRTSSSLDRTRSLPQSIDQTESGVTLHRKAPLITVDFLSNRTGQALMCAVEKFDQPVPTGPRSFAGASKEHLIATDFWQWGFSEHASLLRVSVSEVNRPRRSANVPLIPGDTQVLERNGELLAFHSDGIYGDSKWACDAHNRVNEHTLAGISHHIRGQ